MATARIRCFFIKSIWSQGFGSPIRGDHPLMPIEEARAFTTGSPFTPKLSRVLHTTMKHLTLTVQPSKAWCSEESIIGGGTQGACIQGTNQLLIAAVWVEGMDMLVRAAPPRSFRRPGILSKWISSFLVLQLLT